MERENKKRELNGRQINRKEKLREKQNNLACREKWTERAREKPREGKEDGMIDRKERLKHNTQRQKKVQTNT